MTKEEWDSKTPEQRRQSLDYIIINVTDFKANQCGKELCEIGMKYLFKMKHYEVFKIQYDPVRNINYIFSKEF